MKYDDDQCEECGAARVSGSRLCVRCMVRMITRLENRIANKIEEKDVLREKNKKLTRLCERLLDHIVQEVAYGDELQQARYLKWLKKEGGE